MENKKYYPMTMQQQALADYAAPLQSMELLNEAAYLSFDEAVEETLLQRAVREMIARLPCFRVQMHRGEDGEILQYLSEYVPERIESVELGELDEAERSELFLRWTQEAFSDPFGDIPLYLIRLFRFADGKSGLFFCFEHFIFDGYAAVYALQYLMAVYDALVKGTTLPAPGPEPWNILEQDKKRMPLYEKLLLEQNKSFETEPRFTSLNGLGSSEFVDGAQYGKLMDFTQLAGDVIDYILPVGFAEGIEAAGRENNISPQNYYTLALHSFLGRVSGTDDVTLQMITNCRASLYEKRCGMTMGNSFLFRTVLPEELRFSQALAALTDAHNQALRYVKVKGTHQRDLLQRRFQTPEGCGYDMATLSYFARMKLPEGLPKFHFRFVSNGLALAPFYMIVIPDSNCGTVRASYQYSVNYTRRESVEKFHNFMLRFLENGLNEPETSLCELIDKCI